MREYRGKRIDSGEWVCGHLVEVDSHSFIIVGARYYPDPVGEQQPLAFMKWSEVDPDTVGQSFEYFGKKFFANDIVLIPCYCDSEYGCSHSDGVYEIVWNPETAGYALRHKGVGRFEALDNYDSDDMTTIGNRWDHPHLLGEDSK